MSITKKLMGAFVSGVGLAYCAGRELAARRPSTEVTRDEISDLRSQIIDLHAELRLLRRRLDTMDGAVSEQCH